ncbi:hypothetical protein MRX96_041633 [Rhipicephalus microplus]
MPGRRKRRKSERGVLNPRRQKPTNRATRGLNPVRRSRSVRPAASPSPRSSLEEWGEKGSGEAKALERSQMALVEATRTERRNTLTTC